VPDDGKRDWWEANTFAAQMESGLCDLTDHSQPGDWRLPTRAEWETTVEHAVFHGCTLGAGKDPSVTNNPGTDCLSVGPTAVSNVESWFYWSSSSNGVSPAFAWEVNLQSGGLDAVSGEKTFDYYVWLVRGGQ